MFSRSFLQLSPWATLPLGNSAAPQLFDCAFQPGLVSRVVYDGIRLFQPLRPVHLRRYSFASFLLRETVTLLETLYDHLFREEFPEEKGGFLDNLNPASLEVLKDCRLEAGLTAAEPLQRYQFLRQGYFCVDPVDSAAGRPIFNRTVGLRDSWAKIERAQKKGSG